MKSAELFDNNNEANRVLLEIWEPSLIVLPIPERTSLANISFRLWLKLTNQTLKPWKINPDGIIIPELIASDGKLLERELTTDNRKNEANRPYQGDNLVNKVVYFISNLIDHFAKRGISWVSTKRATSISITANICWKKDLLQLQLLTNRYQALNSSFFDGIKPENYQLRFIYYSSSKIKPQPEKETFQTINKKPIKGDKLTTYFVNLRLVYLTNPNDKVIEVDGIRFETILPETVLTFPEKKGDIRIPVQIGIRINNNTPNSLRFSFYRTLSGEIVTPNGQIVSGIYRLLGVKSPKESDFPLVLPGKNLTFFPKALFEFKGDRFTLSIALGDGGFLSFEIFKPGIYQIRFTYNNKFEIATIYEREIKNTRLIENIWMGRISTPFVGFCFRTF
ncbi:hypothetical protein [Okeania sp. KiyG1]|uniref:hypothetical protein n=1 Tax=Okeania sp. KiyG1 TaxID=2720165 RepID=UPI001920AA29|nr:hypothetical protein [Okeania sp. KiyG1]GGA25945.1 hypothetical protein CYANOKiyG1_41860 [Okeania sp. KiyG1]